MMGYCNVEPEIRNYLRYQAGSRSLVFDLSVTEHFGSSSHPQQNGLLTLRRTTMRHCVLLHSARSILIGNSTLTIRTFLFSPPLLAPAHACTANFCVFFFYRPTGRPKRTLQVSNLPRNRSSPEHGPRITILTVLLVCIASIWRRLSPPDPSDLYGGTPQARCPRSRSVGTCPKPNCEGKTPRSSPDSRETVQHQLRFDAHRRGRADRVTVL
jgi:hypothetical protein